MNARRTAHSFLAHTTALCEDDSAARKGQRTRNRLKAAAAQALEENGFHALKMGDVCAAADVSQGAIYQYFDNKQHITFEVLKDFNFWIGDQLQDVPSRRRPVPANLLGQSALRPNCGS